MVARSTSGAAGWGAAAGWTGRHGECSAERAILGLRGVGLKACAFAVPGVRREGVAARRWQCQWHLGGTKIESGTRALEQALLEAL